MGLMVILSEVKVIMLLIASFSLAPATAMGLRSTMPVRTASMGRPFRARTATTHGASTSSIRVATARATVNASTGCLFVLSKGSPNSERM